MAAQSGQTPTTENVGGVAAAVAGSSSSTTDDIQLRYCPNAGIVRKKWEEQKEAHGRTATRAATNQEELIAITTIKRQNQHTLALLVLSVITRPLTENAAWFHSNKQEYVPTFIYAAEFVNKIFYIQMEISPLGAERKKHKQKMTMKIIASMQKYATPSIANRIFASQRTAKVTLDAIADVWALTGPLDAAM